MSDIRVRFAPSPTGYLHIGGLRTALYNYLFAKQNNGNFLLRIEDTDRTRYVDGAIENLIHELNWAKVSNDEGVVLKDGKITEIGECGPYIQSERVNQNLYAEYINILLEKGMAYYCFCSKERIEEVKKQQKADGLMPKYDGHCRGISLEEAKERVANGEEYVIRLKLPKNEDIKFQDHIKGAITINTDDMDDQVLIKSDGFPTYHFAVVVDDHLMGITHVVRGDEWISSTPKHILIYRAFGWDVPEYIHLPVVLNKSGKKLSKRNDDVSVADFREKGYLPEALINYLALVGWSPSSNEEILTMEQLIDDFTFERVQKSGAVFDIDKLDWINAQYIKKLTVPELSQWIRPYMLQQKYIDEKFSEDKLNLIAETFQDSLYKLTDIVDQSRFLFKRTDLESDARDFITEEAKVLAQSFVRHLESIDEVNLEFSQSIMKKIQKETGIKGKGLYMPVRAMITGNLHGPELSNIISILGKDELIRRLTPYI